MNRLPRSIVRSAQNAALFAVSLLASGAAVAEPEHEAEVGLSVSACPEDVESELRRILAIELGELLHESSAAEIAKRDSIQIVCEVEEAKIVASSAGGDQVIRNDVRFDAFPGDAAPRAIALAALEALRAVAPTLLQRLEAQRKKTRRQLATTEAQKTRLPAPVASAPAPSRTSHAFTRILAGGGGRFFFGEPQTSAFGARVELSRRFAAPWDAGLDFEAAFVRRTVRLGAAEARIFSAAAWFGARAGGTRWSTTAALGARFGVALLEGTPSAGARGHEVTRPYSGPLLLVRADGIAGALALALNLEGGFAAVGAQGLAAGEPALALASVWLAASANAGLRF